MFTISFWDKDNGWIEIAAVSGCEFSWIAYNKARELAEMVGKDCALINAETGEVILHFDPNEG